MFDFLRFFVMINKNIWQNDDRDKVEKAVSAESRRVVWDGLTFSYELTLECQPKGIRVDLAVTHVTG